MPKRKVRSDVGTPHKGEHLTRVSLNGKVYDIHAWGPERRRVYHNGRYVGMYREDEQMTYKGGILQVLSL